ncbi:MAG: hypothetical protein GY943_09385 [Chloroflexi bacterium]|nr:hypothetical protein [Chloroflexota bacterium]
MRLEKKQDEEIAKRKGMTGRTLIQIVWLGLSAAVAYGLLAYMNGSDEIRFSYGMIYRILSIPGSVPQWVVIGGLILIFVLIMQIFLSLGFVIASPEGRRKTGQASMHSRNRDPFDDR